MKTFAVFMAAVALACAATPPPAAPAAPVAAVVKWEYATLFQSSDRTGWDDGHRTIGAPRTEFVAKLVGAKVISPPASEFAFALFDALGERGWELVAVVRRDDSPAPATSYYFKRRKN